MHVKYFYPWGYSYPAVYGSDRVAANHLEYFRARNWTVELITPDHPNKRKWAEEFRNRYDWLHALHVVDYFPPPSGLRDTLFSYERLARTARMKESLSGPVDLFYTNYVFTSPLLEHVPRDCRKVMESHDIMTQQYALADRLVRGGSVPADPIARARDGYLMRTEFELYRLFDAVVMINPNEQKFAHAQGITHTTFVPQMYETSSARAKGDPEFDLIFVGSDVLPNVQGMTWFYRNVYVPHLWRHRVRLAIVGGVCNCLDIHDAYVTRFSWVQGPLDDLYANTKLTIVPIFEGTGMAIKTLEGLAMGQAMVVSPVGARGLDDAGNAFVKMDMRADPKRVAEVILDLLANPGKREKLRNAASAYVRRCFSREAFFGGMDRVMKSIGIDPTSAGNGAEENSRLKTARIHASRPVAPVRSH